MATYRGMRVDLLTVTQWPGQPLRLKPSPLHRAVAVKASMLQTSALRLAAVGEKEAEATGLGDTTPVRLRTVIAPAAAVCVCVCVFVRTCVYVCVCGRAAFLTISLLAFVISVHCGR